MLMLMSMVSVSEERGVFLREQSNSMYSVWIYFLARTSIDIIPTFLSTFTLALVCFWMIDSSFTFIQFLKFISILVLLAYCGQGIGLIVSCGIPSRMLAMIVTPLAIAPFILFTPYAVSDDSIPWFFRPFQVGSPFWVSVVTESCGGKGLALTKTREPVESGMHMSALMLISALPSPRFTLHSMMMMIFPFPVCWDQWGFTGLMLSQFSGLHFHCTQSQLIPIPLRDGSFYMLCPYESGEAVLARFDIRATLSNGTDHFTQCCLVLMMLCFCYRIIAVLMLYRLSWKVKDATK